MPFNKPPSIALRPQPLSAQLLSIALLPYAGNELKYLRVNAAGDDYELVAGGGVATNGLCDLDFGTFGSPTPNILIDFGDF